MSVLRRKEERTQTVTVRVPASVKADLDRLREETSAAGFDLNATLSEVVVRVSKQIREELGQLNGRAKGSGRTDGLVVADGKGARAAVLSAGVVASR